MQPATHAAAFAVTDSNAAAHFLAYLTRNSVNPDSFVAAFRVEKSYLAGRLETLEWLQAEEILEFLAHSAEPPGSETHQSRAAPRNQYIFYGDVTGSAFADGGKVTINDPVTIDALVAAVRRHRDEVQLSAEQREALEKAVADLRRGINERKSEPSAVREALTSIRHIFEDGAGAMIGHAAPEWLPALSHQIETLLNLLR